MSPAAGSDVQRTGPGILVGVGLGIVLLRNVLEKGDVSPNVSGRQEMLESIFAAYLEVFIIKPS